MRQVIACTAALVFVAFLSTPSSSAKTARECNEEYAASKAAIKDSGQKKKDFITACRAGTEMIPGGAAAAPTTTQPTPTAAPAPAAPASAPAPTVNRQRAPTPSATTTGTPSESASEAEAKARCPNDTVVWVNPKSKVYHFAGGREYGKTKRGSYMCETQATAAGNRAAKNEKHP